MDTTIANRDNERWLSELSGDADAGAVSDLCRYVRGGLGKALSRQSDVTDTDLDDYAQDAMMRILAGLDSFRGNSRFTTWAMAVAIRTAFSSLRRRRYGDLSLDALRAEGVPMGDAGGDQPDADLQRTDLLTALHHAIEHALTDKQRQVVLGELGGASTDQICEAMGTNANALYKLYHDARKKLRAALIERGFDDADVRQTLDGASEK